MANRKPARKLTTNELEERAQQRSQQTNRRWQQFAFIAISVIVLLSMVMTLFMK
jgi:hypothetical protein